MSVSQENYIVYSHNSSLRKKKFHQYRIKKHKFSPRILFSYHDTQFCTLGRSVNYQAFRCSLSISPANDLVDKMAKFKGMETWYVQRKRHARHMSAAWHVWTCNFEDFNGRGWEGKLSLHAKSDFRSWLPVKWGVNSSKSILFLLITSMLDRQSWKSILLLAPGTTRMQCRAWVAM